MIYPATILRMKPNERMPRPFAIADDWDELLELIPDSDDITKLYPLNLNSDLPIAQDSKGNRYYAYPSTPEDY